MSQTTANLSAPQAVFADPIVQLAALCPICALAALNPTAALSALSPVLAQYNPAINPAAAIMSFYKSPMSVRASIRARISAQKAGLQLVKAGLSLLTR